MNKKQYYKEVHKADEHSNAFIEELESTYPADVVPLHLAILMTKCVYGLVLFGIKKEDVIARLAEDMDRYEKLHRGPTAN